MKQGSDSVHPPFFRCFRVLKRVPPSSSALFLGVQVQAMQQVLAVQVERNPIGAGKNTLVLEAGCLLAERLDPCFPVLG